MAERGVRQFVRRPVMALMAGVAIGAFGVASPSAAQDVGRAVSSSRPFNIPAQPVASALTAFGDQSGLQVTADTTIVIGITSQAVSGNFAPYEALSRLLSGTGLTWRSIGERAIRIERVPQAEQGTMQLGPVRVEGSAQSGPSVPPQAAIGNLPPVYAGGHVATGAQVGLLGNRGVMDTPFNQTSYTAQKALDQQAKTIKDVLIDDPSVRITSFDGGPGVESVTIRGFETNSSEIAYGGLYGVLPTFSPMAEVAERVELLKGPSVLLNGMSPGGSIGGTINIIPKRAPDGGIMQATASYLSTSQFGGHIDVGDRFGAEGQVGLRFNGVYQDGEGNVRNNGDRRGLALLGADFRGNGVRLSADLGYQYQKITGVISYIGLDDGVPVPRAPSGRINQGQPWSYNDYDDLFGAARAEVDLSSNVTAYAALGAHKSEFGSLYSSIITLLDGSGSATEYAPFDIEQERKAWTGTAGVRANFRTGPISHQLAVSGSIYRSEFAQGFVWSQIDDFASNIYRPAVIARPQVPKPDTAKASSSSESSVGIADTLSAAGERVQLTLGGRWQQTGSKGYSNGAVYGRYDESAFSPAIALVVKPSSHISLYANYIQGLQQGTVVSTTYSNAGQIFPPYRSKQYEVGMKFDFGVFTATADVFQIAQPSVITDVPTNRLLLNGERRNRGLELNLFGQPAKGVRLLGGVMLLDSKLTKTQDGANDGWRSPASPKINANLAAEWDVPFISGLTVDGRVIYTSQQYIDTELPRRTLPDWTRIDLGVRQTLANPIATGKALTVRLDVENIAGSRYWSAGGNYLVVGKPRTLRLSVTADF